MSTHRGATGLAVALWAVTMVLVGTGLVLAVVIGHNLGSLLWSWSLAEVTIAASFSTVGMVLAARRPRNPIGWLFALLGLGPAGGFFAAQYDAVSLGEANSLVRAGLAVLERMPAPVLGYLVLLLLLFPHGTLLSRRWRPLVWATVGAMAVATLAMWTGDPGIVYERAEVVIVVALVAATVSLVLRWRRAVGEERQQIKVFVWVTALAIVVLFGGVFAGVAPITNTIALPAIPVATGLAVLRYRLYDIDRVISRTVSYGLLTGLLVAIYLGAVFALQQLLRPVTGESQLAVAGATLVVAGLFGPLRRRIQATVDRRFNRARYDAQRTVEAFRARLRDEVDIDELTTELVSTADAAVAPVTAQVWLYPREPTSR